MADDHDVSHFLTHSLYPPGQLRPDQKVSLEEQQKLSQEYMDYQKKLEQRKEEYRRYYNIVDFNAYLIYEACF